MSSLSEPRYCALGERCVRYDPHTGKPEKLSRYNKESVCEACQWERVQQSDNEPPFRTEEDAYEQFVEYLRAKRRQVLPSDAARHIFALKRTLIEQLYLRRGPFWEAVRDMRAHWGITTVTGVPDTAGPPGPPQCAPKRPEEGGGEEEWETFCERWSADLFSIQEQYIPAYFHNGCYWWDFLNTCVLYDPPIPGLPAFAKRGGIRLSSGIPEGVDDTPKLPIMARPPIAWLRDPDEVEAVESWILKRLIHELGERHLKPLGLDVYAMADDVLRNTPGLWEEYMEKHNRLMDRRRPYIRVDEHTTKDDVQRASQIIRRTHKQRPSASRSKRDRLVCIECAVLKDQHDWSDEKLAERYGWKEPSTVSKYVREGQAIIKGG